jgi:hypothetical protein
MPRGRGSQKIPGCQNPQAHPRPGFADENPASRVGRGSPSRSCVSRQGRALPYARCREKTNPVLLDYRWNPDKGNHFWFAIGRLGAPQESRVRFGPTRDSNGFGGIAPVKISGKWARPEPCFPRILRGRFPGRPTTRVRRKIACRGLQCQSDVWDDDAAIPGGSPPRPVRVGPPSTASSAPGWTP